MSEEQEQNYKTFTLQESGMEVKIRKMRVREYKRLYRSNAKKGDDTDDLDLADQVIILCSVSPKFGVTENEGHILPDGEIDLNDDLSLSDYMELVLKTQDFSGLKGVVETVRPTSETETRN